jgi:quinol monooxygenase YgiN
MGRSIDERQPGSVSVNVVLTLRALPAKAAELLPLLQEGRDISRSAYGCESFDLFQRGDDENRCMFLEEWSSIEDHQQEHVPQHRGQWHLMRILPLIVGPPDNGVIRLVE